MGKPENHWCRKIMDESTKRLVANLDHTKFDAIEISGRQWKKFQFKSYINYTYPAFDVCNISAEYENTADIILLEQVLEHVKNPWKAIENIKKMLRPGGYLLVTTPFYIKIHGAPMDYWRWTKDGLAVLLEDSGLTVETVDSWGNRDCIVANFDVWENYQVGYNLTNELELPLMVWALARKV